MTETEPKKRYTIPEAAKELGFTPAYVRTLIRKSQIKTNLVPIAEGADVLKHVISAAELERFRKLPHRTRRADGRNKYVFYATPFEAQAVVDAIKAAGLDEVAEGVKTANPLKPQEAKNGKILSSE